MATVKEIQSMPEGQVITDFMGELAFVNAPKDGKFGREQFARFKDDADDIIGLVLKDNHAVLTEDQKGQRFFFKSNNTSSYGLQGLKVTHNGQYTNVKVTKAADMTPATGSVDTPPPLPDDPETPATAPVTSSPQRTAAPAPSGGRHQGDMASYFVNFYKEVYTEALASGLSDVVAHELAMKANDWGPLHWFGEKIVPFNPND